MRFGKWRGMPLTVALAITLGLGLISAKLSRAGENPFSHTLPGEVPAYDFTTGGPYMAPPIPYGHYAKDNLGHLHEALACPGCKLKSLFGGAPGHGLFHHGDGDGQGGHGFGHGQGGDGSGGHGFGHGHGATAFTEVDSGFGSATGSVGYPGNGGMFHHGSASGPMVGTAVVGGSYAGAAILPTGQISSQASGQSVCGQPGCGMKAKHSHRGQAFNKNGCGSCGGRGCGNCGGNGLAGLHDGSGHGMGHGNGHNTGCGLCGGKGCGNCLGGLKSGVGGLGSSIHGKLASLAGMMHPPKLTWFVGPGGPVPLTPGYVPYVVTTRSPRDYFSFAPMNPNDP